MPLISGERERGQLRDQVKQLQAANQRQTDDLARANFTIDVCREQLEKLKQTAQPAGPTSQAPATPSGSHLPMHQEMGGNVRLPIASNPSLVLAAMLDGQSVPPTLTPMRHNTPDHAALAPLRYLCLRPSLQPVLLPHHGQVGRRTWTRSPSRGQSPSSRGHHGVEEQVSPIAPRTPLIFMRRTGIKEQASCLIEDPTAAGPLGPGTDCQLVMLVSPRVVNKL